MPRVSLPQLQTTYEFDDSKSLMEWLMDQGIPVASSCRGDGICGKCKMEVESLKPLPAPSALEKKTLEKNQAHPKERLSCQIGVTTDLQLKTGYW